MAKSPEVTTTEPLNNIRQDRASQLTTLAHYVSKYALPTMRIKHHKYNIERGIHAALRIPILYTIIRRIKLALGMEALTFKSKESPCHTKDPFLKTIELLRAYYNLSCSGVRVSLTLQYRILPYMGRRCLIPK